MDNLKSKISNVIHHKQVQDILEKNNESIFQSNAIYVYKEKLNLYHYNIPKHDGKKLFIAYKNLLNNNLQPNAQKILELLNLTNINMFIDGSVKEEALHIPGPGLCWMPVVLKENTKVLLFNASINSNNNISVTNWKTININKSMTSIKSCEMLLANYTFITDNPSINLIIGCPLDININDEITYLG